MDETEFTGVILDPRTPEEKERDYYHDDVTLASASQFDWKELKEFPFYSKRNQTSSSSCMAHSGAKILGISNAPFIELSAKATYLARTNTGGGMYQKESLSFLCKPLSPSESLLPSNGLNESQINSTFIMTEEMKASAELHKGNEYVTFGKEGFAPDMDKVAEAIEAGHPVQAMLFFLKDEANEYWKEVPEVIDNDLKYWEDKASRHGVALIKPFLYKGKRAFLEEDSAGNSSSIKKDGKPTGQRIITEDFFKKRCYAAGYVTKDIPKDLIVPTLRTGAKGEMVKRLQKKLTELGYDLGAIDGIFGQRTKIAVVQFQAKNILTPDGIVGKNTVALLNK